jgi:hypothetical protein
MRTLLPADAGGSLVKGLGLARTIRISASHFAAEHRPAQAAPPRGEGPISSGSAGGDRYSFPG